MLTVLEAAASHDLTTLDTAKAELGISGTASDADLTRLIRQASSACTRYTRRDTFGRELVEQVAGLALPVPADGVILERDIAPIIESVTLGGQVMAPDDYLLDGPILRRAGASMRYGWAYFPMPVTVIYRAGYDLLGGLPDDIERACLVTIRAMFHGRGRDPNIRQMSTDGIGSVTYATAGLAASVPQEAKELLEPYRRFGGM